MALKLSRDTGPYFSDPIPGLTPIGTIEPNDTLIPIEEMDTWYKVHVQRGETVLPSGWVSSEHVTETSDEEAYFELYLGPNEGYRSVIIQAADRLGVNPADFAKLINAKAEKNDVGPWDERYVSEDKNEVGLARLTAQDWLAVARTKGSVLNQAGRELEYISDQDTIFRETREKLLDLRKDGRIRSTRWPICPGAIWNISNRAAFSRVGNPTKARSTRCSLRTSLAGVPLRSSSREL